MIFKCRLNCCILSSSSVVKVELEMLLKFIFLHLNFRFRFYKFSILIVGSCSNIIFAGRHADSINTLRENFVCQFFIDMWQNHHLFSRLEVFTFQIKFLKNLKKCKHTTQLAGVAMYGTRSVSCKESTTRKISL